MKKIFTIGAYALVITSVIIAAANSQSTEAAKLNEQSVIMAYASADINSNSGDLPGLSYEDALAEKLQTGNYYISAEILKEKAKTSPAPTTTPKPSAKATPKPTPKPALKPAPAPTTKAASTPAPKVPAKAAPSGVASKIISTSKNYLGVPYVWGGTSPQGFDCSGFIQYVFSKNGISLPRVTSDQYNAGTSVSKSNLIPGDLVFFETYKPGPSHIGIYLGNNQFIHASSGAEKVTISNLTSTYYTSHYIGARRVIK